MRDGTRTSTTTTSTRVRLLTALVLVVLVTLATAAAVPAAARAQETLDADELGIDVEVGYAGLAVRGRWLPVTVTLAPTRLFAGDVGVVADTNSGRMVESREVEVAAGSTKVFRFLVPPSNDVTVQLAETDEDEGLTVRAPLRFADTFLVGVLGDALPRELPPITSTPLDQRGTFVAVPPAFLERSSRSLDPLSALVVSSRDLAALGDEARSRLAAAVAVGTDLVVTAAGDGALDLGLPWTAASAATTVQATGPTGGAQGMRVLELGDTAWGLTPADLGWGEEARPVAAAVNAGKGRLMVAGVGLGEGPAGSDGTLWGRLLQPNLPTSSNSDPGGGFDRLAQVAGEGLRSDTVELPPASVLIGFLLAYLLLVGPVNGFVLARLGRRELAWVSVPALTLVFTVGAFLTAAGTEVSTGLSGRAAYWIDGQGTQVQAAAIRAPRVGDHELRFPGGDWDLAPATWSPAPAVIDRRDGDTVMRFALEALQVGTATAMRDLSTPAPLALDLDAMRRGRTGDGHQHDDGADRRRAGPRRHGERARRHARPRRDRDRGALARHAPGAARVGRRVRRPARPRRDRRGPAVARGAGALDRGRRQPRHRVGHRHGRRRPRPRASRSPTGSPPTTRGASWRSG